MSFYIKKKFEYGEYLNKWGEREDISSFARFNSEEEARRVLNRAGVDKFDYEISERS